MIHNEGISKTKAVCPSSELFIVITQSKGLNYWRPRRDSNSYGGLPSKYVQVGLTNIQIRNMCHLLIYGGFKEYSDYEEDRSIGFVEFAIKKISCQTT